MEEENEDKTETSIDWSNHFFVFSQILEGIPKAAFFAIDSPVSRYVWTHAWAYVLVGTLLAGIFEETGRYVAFRFFLKKYQLYSILLLQRFRIKNE